MDGRTYFAHGHSAKNIPPAPLAQGNSHFIFTWISGRFALASSEYNRILALLENGRLHTAMGIPLKAELAALEFFARQQAAAAITILNDTNCCQSMIAR